MVIVSCWLHVACPTAAAQEPPAAAAEEQPAAAAEEPAEAAVQEPPAADDAAVREGVLTSHLSELYSIPMIPLWLCSIVMLTLIFERFRALKARKILDPKLAERVVKLAGDNDLRQAHEEASKSRSLVGQAWAQGLHEFLLGGVSLDEALTNSTVLAFKPLKRNLQGISTIAVIAPLLGLLGTVIGMVLVFDEISVVQNPDKQRMAEGIMVALFTTVFGITIAVPGIALGRYFTSRLISYAEAAEADIDRIRYRYAHAMAQQSESGQPETKSPL